MSDMWKDFDNTIDSAALAEDVKKVDENNGQGNRDVPTGTYEVSIQKLELTKSKKGDPMVVCWMRIVNGQYKGSLLFMNNVITRDFQVAGVNRFLNDLISELPEAPEVKFERYYQYGNLLMDIREAIDGKYEYLVDFSKRGDFPVYQIKEVYVLED